MQQCSENHNCTNPDTFDADNKEATDSGDVPQKTSQEVILEFLEEHDYPHQQKGIYGGLIYTGDITFGYSAVQTAVAELRRNGHVRKVVIDTDDGFVRDFPEGSNGRGYYVITDAGRERISD